MVDVLKITIGVEDHHFIARKRQGNTINKRIYDYLIPHVLALVDQRTIGLADLVDLLAVVPDDVKIAVDFLLVLDLEVETTAE